MINTLEQDIMNMLTKNGQHLQYISKDNQTVEFIQAALLQNVSAIKHVSHKLLTYSMCEFVLMKQPSLIKYIPKQILDKKLCHLAIKFNYHINVIKYVPKEYLDDEICQVAVKSNYESAEYFNASQITLETCEYVFMQSKTAVHYIKNPTPEQIDLALEINPLSLFNIDPKYLVADIITNTIINNKDNVSFMNNLNNGGHDDVLIPVLPFKGVKTLIDNNIMTLEFVKNNIDNFKRLSSDEKELFRLM